MFGVFKQLSNTYCVIGESDDNLYDLVQACLTADILVIWTRQRMLPKLLSIYHDATRPKIILVLTPDGMVEDYAAILGLPAEAVKVIQVPIGKGPFSDLWPVLTAAAKHYNMPLVPKAERHDFAANF